MIDKHEVLDILRQHLGESAGEERLEAAAEALMERMQQEWVEVTLDDREMGYTMSNELVDVCLIDRLLNEGYEIRILRSKEPVHEPGVLERKYLEHLQEP